MDAGYKLVLFVHVLSIVMLGIAIVLDVVAIWGMRMAPDVRHVRAWLRLANSVGPLFPVSGVLLLISGIYLMAKVWNWSTAWIFVGLASLALMAIVGTTLDTALIHQIGREAAMAGDQDVPGPLARAIRNPILWTSLHVDITGVAAIIVLLTVKPSTWLVAIAIMGAAVVVGIVASIPFWRMVEPIEVQTTSFEA